MLSRSLKLMALAAGIIVCGMPLAWARHGTAIKIPLRSKLTPVQRLNREGVQAIKKRDYEKAQKFFYKAYLYDPADPFTLNNLGYVAELQGQIERAHKFYDLAAEQGSDANIDISSVKQLQGQPMKAAVVDLKDDTMRMNRQNIDAMRLLSQDRGFEAIELLKRTLKFDPQNPFTLNNLGVASEAIGDLDGAERYYTQAASSGSKEAAIVTADRRWRGKSVSTMADASAKRVQKIIDSRSPTETQAVMLTLQGVHAANQNDWTTARKAFIDAYKLDPRNAFALNNAGYVAEHDGDLETAQFFYEKARNAANAGAQVGMATQLAAQGQPMGVVASGSTDKVDDALEAYARQRRNEKAPIELTPRGNTPGSETPNPQ